MSSLNVFEQFMGEPLAADTLKRLLEAPDDHIACFGHALSEGWDGWLTDRFGSDQPPNDPLFLQSEFHHGVTSIITEATCKRLALYFDRIVVADPVEVAVATRMMAWSMTDLIDLEAYRQELRVGFSSLLNIAPLLRSGAITIAPLAQGGLRPEVQDYARRELAGINSLATAWTPDEAEEFALGSALCVRTLHWPVAGSERLWHRLRSTPKILQGCEPKSDALAQAVAEFQVPSVSNVPMDDLLALRSGEASFTEFREAYGTAMLEAAGLARREGNAAAQALLRDRLQIHSDRCVATARRISALDGLIMPTGALLGAACVSYSLGALPTSMSELTKLGTDLVAPGALWLVVRLLQALRSAGSGSDAAAAVYGALLERPERAPSA